MYIQQYLVDNFARQFAEAVGHGIVFYFVGLDSIKGVLIKDSNICGEAKALMTLLHEQ